MATSLRFALLRIVSYLTFHVPITWQKGTFKTYNYWLRIIFHWRSNQLPGTHSHGGRFYSENVWNFLKENVDFSSDSCLLSRSSRRVGIYSRVWNRNAEDCFYSKHCYFANFVQTLPPRNPNTNCKMMFLFLQKKYRLAWWKFAWF